MAISPQSPLFFMHIPKTGGMSMFTALATQWGTSIADLYDVSIAQPQPAVDALKDASKAIYCGHYSYGMHEFLDRPSHYASVLREPVDRVESLYHFCMLVLSKLREAAQKEGVSAQTLISQKRVGSRDYYLDFAPWIEGDGTPETFFACPSADLENGMVRRFSGVGLAPGPCPASALELAKQNIERHFAVVGLLERYPETLQLLERRLGIPRLPEHKVNDNKSRAQAAPLSPAILEKIRSMNQLDLALYDWAAKRFDRQLAETSTPQPVPPGRRTDYEKLPLWWAVGNSPLRELAMKTRQVPGAPQKLQCLGLSRVLSTPNGVRLELHTRNLQMPKGVPPNLTQLGLSPVEAKQLAIAMAQAVQAFEKVHGPIQLPPPPARP